MGFGPANVALAAALSDAADGGGARLSARFFERQPSFGWHTGMLLPGATMQVAFLKDLATLRSPRSRFTFVNYLHEHGRLVDFINHKTLFPTRAEFHDYLAWVVADLNETVDYASDVRSIQPDGDLLRVSVERPDGSPESVVARNVVVGVGLDAFLPSGLTASDSVWHSRDLLTRLGSRDLGPGFAGTFVVVGAGQSAAEVAAHLHDVFPACTVRSVFTRFGYSPADDSPFANRIFDPSAVDDYFGAPPEVRRMLDLYHANTNYSVVDQDLITELYQRTYREGLSGNRRLIQDNVTRVVSARTVAGRVQLEVEHLLTQERELVHADVVVCATGYRPQNLDGLLTGVDDQLLRDDMGRLAVDRDYRVRTSGDVGWSIYLQGGTEHSHGLSSSLLSNTAVRAEEIRHAISADARAESVA